MKIRTQENKIPNLTIPYTMNELKQIHIDLSEELEVIRGKFKIVNYKNQKIYIRSQTTEVFYLEEILPYFDGYDVTLQVMFLELYRDRKYMGHNNSFWCQDKFKIKKKEYKIIKAHFKEFKLDKFKLNFDNGLKITSDELIVKYN